LHTRKNVVFELEAVFPHLSSHAVAIVDDADANGAFEGFRRKHALDGWGVMSPTQPNRGMIGIFHKGSYQASRAERD
jgi:hypothetical protein